ncbi:hypothetical protein HK098_002776 [Nowakowskiella sp. JEL0407]|nr:hypothetical protein HK098_002776 [Nowakowskiella sp. JEL0407]
MAMDRRKTSALGSLKNLVLPQKAVLVDTPSLNIIGYPGLSSTVLDGVITITNVDSQMKHIDYIQVRLKSSLHFTFTPQNEKFDFIRTALDFPLVLLDRAENKIPQNVSIAHLPASGATMYPPPHLTSVLIGEGDGIMLPGKKKAVVPFKLEISQLKAALIPPTISLWRKSFQCNVKYRLIVSVRQEGLNSIIDHEYQIPQMHSFDSSDLAVYMRGQDAVNTFENTTRENIQFKFEFPRILIPGEPWTFSYKFTNLSTKDQKYTVTGLSIDLSELITLNPTTLSALKISEPSDLSKTVFSWKSDDTANQDGQHTTKFITPPWPSTTSTSLGKDSTRDSGINPSGTWDFLTVSHKITVDVSFKGANKLRYEFPVNVLATYKSTIEELITVNPDLLLGAWGERDGTDEAVASVLLKTLTTERLERAEREKKNGGSEDGGVFGSIEVGNSDEDYIRALHDSLITALAADETATIGLKPNETKYSTSTNFGGDLVPTNSLRTVASSVLPPVSEQGEEEAFIRRLEDLQSFDQAVEATTQQHKNEEQGVKEGELPSYKGIQVEARHRVAFAYFPSKGDEIELRVNDLVVVKKVFKDGWIFDSEDTSTSHSEKSNEKSKKKRGTNELDQLPNISEILEKTAGKLTPTSTILNPTKTTTTEESAFYVSNPDSTRQIIHPHSPWTPVTDPLPNPHQQNQQQNQSLDTKNANINSTTQFPIPVSFAPTIKPLGTPPNTTILGKSSPVGMFTSPLSPFKEPVNAFSGGDKVLDMYSQVAVRGDGGDDTRSIKSSTNTVNSGVVSGGGIENNGTMSSYQWTGSQSGSLKGKKNPSFPRSSSSGSGGGNSGNLRSDGKFSSLNSAYIFPNVPNIPMMGGGSGGIGVGDDVLYSSPSSPYMQFGSIGSSVVKFYTKLASGRCVASGKKQNLQCSYRHKIKIYTETSF